MIMEMGWKGWLGIAAVVTAIATGLWALGIIPWWGILIAVPTVTVVAVGALLVFGIMAWMAGGSH